MGMQAIGPGRYVLDAAGVLHPLGAADPVCIVTVRAKLSDLPDAVLDQLKDLPGLPEERARRGAPLASQIAAAAQAVRRHPGGPAKAERNAAIVAAYQAGRNSPGLAREFGVSTKRICQIVEAAGVKMRPRGHHNPKRNCREEGEMADSRRGHEGSAAGREAKAVAPVPSGALRRKDDTPANAGQACTSSPPARFVPGGKIDLSAVRSEMDRRAEKIEAERVREAQARLQAKFAGATALCRCGGTGPGTSGPVPAWFGNDCIEGDCELKRVDRADVRASRSMPPVSGVSA